MRCKLGDISEITKLAGYEFTKYIKYTPDGEIIAVRALNLKNGALVLDDIQRISKEVSETLPRSQLHKNDIVLSYTGTLGECAQIREDGKYHLAPNVCKITPNDSVVNPNFLFQYIRCEKFKQTLINYAHGSTQPTIPMSTIRDIPVDIPDDLEKQGKIAAILSTLDEKIVINRAINNNLEQQARSLFKSWFVDYIPFGNTMPSNWKNGKLKDILKLKRKSIKAGINTVLPYLPIDVIPMRTFALTDFKPNAEAQSSLLTFEKDDIIIGAMRVYFHRVVLAPCDGITRTTCFTLAPYHKEYLSFALLCCDQDSSIDYAQSTSKGSTMPYAIWEGGLGDMEIAIPTLEIAQEFNEIVLPMLRQIQNSYFENNRLREIRDGLLPRLMSGELDVSDIDL